MTTRVTGTYLRPDLSPDRGYIDFTLYPAARQDTGEQITASIVRAELDATGSFSIDLVPDADLQLDGSSLYAISEHIGGTVREWWLSVPDETAIDLPGRYPGATHAPRAYALPIPGPVGPTGPTGPASTVPGPIGPTGPQGERGIQGEQGIPGEIQNSQIWAPGTETLSPLITAHNPATGQLQIAAQEMGDTGWRSLPAQAGWELSAYPLRVRRVGNLVAAWVRNISDGTTPKLWEPTAGFRPVLHFGTIGVLFSNKAAGSARNVVCSYGNGWPWNTFGTPENGEELRGAFSYVTNDPWPSSLPGTTIAEPR